MPKISIIVPVYKVEEYLPRCIDSILAQTFTDFELILIDDGSPDNCGVICDEYAKNDNRIVVIHKENGGVSSARNYGLDIAKGEYISFLDSDDVIHPYFFEIMLKFIDGNDFAFCAYKKFSDNPCFENLDVDSIKPIYYKNNNIFECSYLSLRNVTNKLIKMSVIKDQKFDTNLTNAEDTLFAFNLLQKCNSTVFVNERLYGYYTRTNSAVNSIDFIGWQNVVNVWTVIRDLSNQEGLTIAYDYAQHELLLYTISLFYASKGIDKDIFNKCRKYLLKNLFAIMLESNKKLTIKEKLFLFFKLFLIF